MSPSTLQRPVSLSSILSRFGLYDEDGVAAWKPDGACHANGTEGFEGCGSLNSFHSSERSQSVYGYFSFGIEHTVARWVSVSQDIVKLHSYSSKHHQC